MNDQERAYLALLAAASLVGRAVDRDVRQRAGITHPQFEMLARLDQSPDGVRMTDLAQELILSRSGASYQIQQLETAGYVRRVQDPSDDRGVIAHLTDEGREVLALALQGHRPVVQAVMFDAMDDEQMSALASRLEAIVQTAQEAMAPDGSIRP